MNKSDLIAKMAEKAELSKKDAEKALKAFEETVSEELAVGGQITLIGFGTFKTSERKARVGRNPKTNEEIQIPGATVPSFKAGKTLKDAVNK